jgi:hypothetical protein
MSILGLSEVLQKFEPEKSKMSGYITAESPKQISHKAIFSKKLKFDPLGGFSNFQNGIFLPFLVSHPKKTFSIKVYFCFQKNILGLHHKYNQRAGLV